MREGRNLREHRRFGAFPGWVQELILEACQAEGVGVADICSYCEHPRICTIRYAVWSRQRERVLANGKPASYPAIGRQWGRHHTTVLRGIMRHRGLWTT